MNKKKKNTIEITQWNLQQTKSGKAQIMCEHDVPRSAIQLTKHTWCKEGRDPSAN